jgi:hypothetical protein
MMSKRYVSVAIVVGFSLAVAFNACSPVKFSSYAGDGVIGKSGDPIPGCSASDLDKCQLKQKSITVRAPTSQVDVLAIIDTSKSMTVERTKLGSRMKTFTDQLQGLDWQLCVTTTDPATAGDLYKFTNDQYVLTKNSPTTNADVDGDGTIDFNDVFLETLGTFKEGSGDEQGIAATGYTISNTKQNCFRDGAALAAVVISDEDEYSAGGFDDTKSSDQWHALNADNKPQFVFDSLQTRFNDDQKIFTFSSIVIRSTDDLNSAGMKCIDEQAAEGYEAFYGRRYEQLSQLTGGITGNICADDYGSQLAGIGTEVKNTLQAVTLECAPVIAPEVTVSTGAQAYTVTGNKIVFASQVAAGTVVTVKYYCGQ